MNSKKYVTTVITSLMLASTTAIVAANVPPPPVNQILGTPDTVFNNFTTSMCRACHGDPSGADPQPIIDLHHQFHGALIPPESDVLHPGGLNYDCVSCHELVYNQQTMQSEWIIHRDCLLCHYQVGGENTLHHRNSTISCSTCHALVDDPADGHYIPTYEVNETTPKTGMGAGESGKGGCRFCHDAGTDNLSHLPVYNPAVLHHSTLALQNNYSFCYDCHDTSNWAQGIRTCERCHSVNSLHAIQADSDNDGVITEGGELAGYGHIGSDSDCLGCHNTRVPEKVVSMPDGGVYAGPLSVTLNARLDGMPATIFHASSNDGTEPDVVANGVLYSGPILLETAPDHTASYILTFYAADSSGAAITQIFRKEYRLGHPPQPAAAAITLQEGGSAAVQLQTGDLDTEEAVFTYGYTPEPACGTVEISSSGLLTFTAPGGCAGITGSLSYLVQDPLGLEGSAALSYTIEPETVPPSTMVSLPGGLFQEQVTVTLTASDNLDSNPVVYYTTDGSEPTSSSPRYESAITFTATTTLKYRAIDWRNNLEPVHTEVYEINHRPQPTAPAIVVARNNSGASQIAPQDPDQGDKHTFTVVTPPAHGTYTLGAGGLITYKPAKGYVGIDSMTVTVSDGRGGAGSTQVKIYVGVQPPPPGCTDSDADGFFAQQGCGTTIDCNDANPLIKPGAAENCTDGLDNNCNSLIDSADPACNALPGPEKGFCKDGIDNDRDGKIDCADTDCRKDPACR